MKTTIDIPEDVLQDAMRFTRARTKREAVLTALKDFNRRKRIAALAKHFGTSETFMTHAELIRLRQTE
jgi:Arc/MetJ family transcription regulator